MLERKDTEHGFDDFTYSLVDFLLMFVISEQSNKLSH